MRKYFRCELKKFFSYCLFATILLTIGLVLWQATHNNTFLSGDSGVGVTYFGLSVLAFINPIVVYSFKMKTKSVDEYYSLPIKREKLYLIRTLVGVCLTLIPFTVAYWIGALLALCRMGMTYQMQWYFIGYPVFLLLGACLFVFNAFAFTRANRVLDGILFMAAYSLLGGLIIAYVIKAAHVVAFWWIDEGFVAWGAINIFGRFINGLIVGSAGAHCTWWVFLYPLITGIACFVGLYVSAKKERAENAEQISEGWFCYKLLIPVFTALSIGLMPFSWLGFALIVAGSIAVTIIYRRVILFSWKYWLMLAIGVSVGIVLMFLVGALAPPIVNPPDFA